MCTNWEEHGRKERRLGETTNLPSPSSFCATPSPFPGGGTIKTFKALSPSTRYHSERNK